MEFLFYWAYYAVLQLWKPLCGAFQKILEYTWSDVFMYYGLCLLLHYYLSPSPKGLGEGNSVLSVWRHWFLERQQKFSLDLQTLVQHLHHLLHIQNIGKFMPSAWKHLHHVPPLKVESPTHGPCRECEVRQPSRGVCFALLRFYVSGDTTMGNITNPHYLLSISGKNWKWENVKFSQSSRTEIPSLGFWFSKSLNYCSETSSATSQSPFRMSCKEGIYMCLCQYSQS